MSGDFLFKHGENAMTDDLDASSSPPVTEDQSTAPSAGLQIVLASDFAQHGADAVKALRLERPHDYLKLVAALTPKNVPTATPTVEDMTDDEFIRVLNALRPRTSGGGSAPDGDAST
jgi:hypothetical protein